MLKPGRIWYRLSGHSSGSRGYWFATQKAVGCGSLPGLTLGPTSSLGTEGFCPNFPNPPRTQPGRTASHELYLFIADLPVRIGHNFQVNGYPPLLRSSVSHSLAKPNTRSEDSSASWHDSELGTSSSERTPLLYQIDSLAIHPKSYFLYCGLPLALLFFLIVLILFIMGNVPSTPSKTISLGCLLRNLSTSASRVISNPESHLPL